jgi:hypothetical protein
MAMIAEEEEKRRQEQGGARGAVKEAAKRELKRRALQALRARLAPMVARAVAVLFGPEVLTALGIAAVVIIAILLVIFIIVATISVLCNPQGLGQNLVSLTANFSGIISSETCQAFSGLSGGISSTIEKGQALFRSSPQVLAQQHNNARYPAGNDPNLQRLIDCVAGRVSGEGSVATIDSAVSCNYTRADLDHVCARCNHSTNSCHYGGATGTTGSLAVDFGGMPGAGNEGIIGPQILQAAIACSAQLGIPLKRATCEAATDIPGTNDNAVACADPRATHVHISIAPCTGDNGPINTR